MPFSDVSWMLSPQISGCPVAVLWPEQVCRRDRIALDREDYVDQLRPQGALGAVVETCLSGALRMHELSVSLRRISFASQNPAKRSHVPVGECGRSTETRP